MSRWRLILIAALVGAFGVFIPVAQADCQPNPGTGSSSDDQIICDGDDTDGVNTGSGNDTVTIISGTVSDTILSEGGTLLVFIDGGALVISASGAIAIFMDGDGSIGSTGDLSLGNSSAGIYMDGNGSIGSTGNLSLGNIGWGIVIDGNGSIGSTGNLSLGNISRGIMVLGDGSITSTGNLSLGDFGFALFIDGAGSITSTGDISMGYNGRGIILGGNGSITSTGNLSLGDLSFAIYLDGNGSITSTGNLSLGNDSRGIIVVGDGIITSTGDITMGDISYAIYIGGSGSITSTGNLSLGDGSTGIYLGGDGNVSFTGDLTIAGTGNGILTGPGSQKVEVDGSISAPLAVLLGDGNDMLYLRPSSNIQGEVNAEGGDDVVIIGNYVVLDQTLLGGETGEINGDLLVIGDGQVCAEDADAVADSAAFAAGLATLDPENGTVSYLGQTYSWAEFEHLMAGGFIAPCVGKINDGRINAYDLGAPDALYCTVEGGVSVWEIDLEGLGTFSFAISAEQIAAAFEAAVSSGVNQVIAQDSLGNVFYALSDGENITFTAPELREEGKMYTFMFDKGRCAIPAE